MDIEHNKENSITKKRKSSASETTNVASLDEILQNIFKDIDQLITPKPVLQTQNKKTSKKSRTVSPQASTATFSQSTPTKRNASVSPQRVIQTSPKKSAKKPKRSQKTNNYELITDICEPINFSKCESNPDHETVQLDLSEASSDDNLTHEINSSAKETETLITINSNKLKHALEILSEVPKMKKKDLPEKQKVMHKFRRTCHEGYDDSLINWQSFAFIVRTIRNLILERNWEHLREMLLLMLKQHKVMKCYIKELTFLYFMINADSIDPAKVEDYFLFCFSTYDKSRKAFREFDIWFKNCDY